MPTQPTTTEASCSAGAGRAGRVDLAELRSHLERFFSPIPASASTSASAASASSRRRDGDDYIGAEGRTGTRTMTNDMISALMSAAALVMKRSDLRRAAGRVEAWRRRASTLSSSSTSSSGPLSSSSEADRCAASAAMDAVGNESRRIEGILSALADAAPRNPAGGDGDREPSEALTAGGTNNAANAEEDGRDNKRRARKRRRSSEAAAIPGGVIDPADGNNDDAAFPLAAAEEGSGGRSDHHQDVHSGQERKRPQWPTKKSGPPLPESWRLPDGWRFPNCTCREAWMRWHLPSDPYPDVEAGGEGGEIIPIPAAKHLYAMRRTAAQIRDYPQRCKDLRNLRRVVGYIEEEVKCQGLWNAHPSREELERWFDLCSDVLFQSPDLERKRGKRDRTSNNNLYKRKPADELAWRTFATLPLDAARRLPSRMRMSGGMVAADDSFGVVAAEATVDEMVEVDEDEGESGNGHQLSVAAVHGRIGAPASEKDGTASINAEELGGSLGPGYGTPILPEGWRLPDDWRVPACTCREAWLRWHLPDPDFDGVPAAKHMYAMRKTVAPRTEYPGKHKDLCNLRRVANFLEEEVKRRGLWKAHPTREELEEWFDLCSHVIFEHPALEEKRPRGRRGNEKSSGGKMYKKKPVEELSWRTFAMLPLDAACDLLKMSEITDSLHMTAAAPSAV